MAPRHANTLLNGVDVASLTTEIRTAAATDGA
jgi:hypothetical protein